MTRIIKFVDKLEGPDKDECESLFATNSMAHVHKVMSTRSPLIGSAARCMLKGMENNQAVCQEEV